MKRVIGVPLGAAEVTPLRTFDRPEGRGTHRRGRGVTSGS